MPISKIITTIALVIAMFFVSNLHGQLTEDVLWEGTSHPEGTAVTVLRNADGVVYSGTLGYGVLRSFDRGVTWYSILDQLPANHISEIIVQSKKTFYVSSLDRGVFKSTDRGKSWIEENDSLRFLGVSSLVVDKGIMVAGTYDGLYTKHVSDTDWKEINLDTTTYGRFRTVQRILCQDNLWIVGGIGVIFYSEDAGVSWHFIKGEFNSDVTFIQKIKQNIFVGTAGDGIFKFDRNRQVLDLNGSTFPDFHNSLALGIFTDGKRNLVLSSNKGILDKYGIFNNGLDESNAICMVKAGEDYLVGTSNGIVTLVKVKAKEQINDDAEAKQMEEIMMVYPNPARDEITIEFSVEEVQTARIQIKTLDGRIIMTPLNFEARPSINNRQQLDIRSIRPGRYILELITDKGSASKLFIVG